MTDDRPDLPPRPQYGEYATPEQQRARLGVPHPAAEEAHTPAPAPQHPAADPAPRRERRSGPVVDRVVTWVLLALGVVTVLSMAPGLFGFDRQLESTLVLFGIDQPLADPAGARTWGMIAGIVLVAGFVATALITWWWMRRGHVAFWIPLVGAFVTIVIVSACTNVPIADDPAFLQLTDKVLGVSIG